MTAEAGSPPLPQSPILTRRTMLVGGALAGASALALGLTPRRAEHRIGNANLERIIPPQIANWRFYTRSGVVLPQLDDPADGYDQVLSRAYESPGLPPIMLVIAYGSAQGGSLQLHRPEICYPSQGFNLSGIHLPDIPLVSGRDIPAKGFTAQRDDRIEQVLYWSRISSAFPRSSAEEYAAIFSAIVKGAVPDGVLVRFSCIDPDYGKSVRILQDFARAMVAALPRRAKPIVLGDLIS